MLPDICFVGSNALNLDICHPPFISTPLRFHILFLLIPRQRPTQDLLFFSHQTPASNSLVFQAPLAAMTADRQTIIEVNRSLRNIKNELENLLEKGVIDDAVFDTIHSSLPAESSLSGPLRTATGSSNAVPAPAPTPTPARPPAGPLPTKAVESLKIKSPSPAPPAYDQTPPPGLPARNAKPVVAQARALYRYAASDGRDLAFEKDDRINVYEYMNQDWWMGQNDRTKQEGIFPRNYVLVEHENKVPVAPAQPQYGYPAQSQGPPAQQNPYNSHVPPMAVSEGSSNNQGQEGAQGDSKVNEYGKKFGKKLGNAAIFGAGATIGGNIVNSIF
ncbi:SH3 domain-containing protein [Dactylonectria estremocensis]|uniref:SH3 domain-containing protein n=1 Tax=Dactylonectria estremocensis TaxID=1079267 RepID=A0A9P9JHB1_9HYPO|nr:SH3 domain-containing protein [Dactylonectria estremocensis]